MAQSSSVGEQWFVDNVQDEADVSLRAECPEHAGHDAID